MCLVVQVALLHPVAAEGEEDPSIVEASLVAETVARTLSQHGIQVDVWQIYSRLSARDLSIL